jgi:uncharacterized membrane protein
MNMRHVLRLSLALLALMAACSVAGWIGLPADAQVPIHWGLDGQADGFAPKIVGLLLVPGIAAVLVGLFVVVPGIEPRSENLQRSRTAYQAIWAGLLVFLAALHATTVAIALGFDLSIPRVVTAGIGFLFIVIGNWLPTLRSTFMVGIRTPWTLTSERSWTVTHRLGGRGFVAVGLASVVLAVIGVAPEILVGVLVGGILFVTAGLFVVSYRVWASDPDRRTSDGQGREPDR